METYYKTIKNINQVYEKYGDLISVDIVVKTKDNKVSKWLRNVDVGKIDNLVKIEYNKDKLIKHILGANDGAEKR